MFSSHTHRYIFLFGCCALAFGMMMGAVPNSVAMLILFGNWLLEGNFAVKWQGLRSNRVFWALSAMLFIHLLGLLWTQDLAAGWDDVRTKAPLLSLPLVFFGTKALSKKELHVILLCFLLGCVTNTLWCLTYSFVLHPHEEIRNASRFMSHIRLGLFLNMAMLVCVWLARQWPSLLAKSAMYALACYFLAVLYLLGLASGMVNFFILAFLVLGFVVFRLSLVFKVFAALTLLSGVALVWQYVSDIRYAQLNIRSGANNREQVYAPSGRPYYHDNTGQVENGNYVRLNMQLEELKRGWNTAFPEDSFSFNPPHHTERFDVLVRYMASKGLNKDSVGLTQLSALDKKNIRQGIVNYQYPEWNYLHRRTYELVNEWEEYTNRQQVNGHSLTMRLYFWNAALQVIKQQPWFGVGTGDVQQAMNEAYTSTKSPLSKEWYKRPHNQFLTVCTALGIFGLLVFCFSLFYPALSLRKQLHGTYWLFFISALLSFVTEDTLETQAGLTFFAFFQTLFITQAWYHTHQKATNS